MDEKILKKINIAYTELLTHTYKGNAASALADFCDLLKTDSDKMSIQLFADSVKKYKDALPDTGKLKIAERISGRNGDMTTGITFLALSKGDKKTAETLNKYALEMTASALAENPSHKERCDNIVALCNEFSSKEKQLIRMKQAGDIMAAFDEIRGKK